MALILNLETATKACSVSLAKDGKELKTIEVTTDHFSHSENLTVFIQSLFEKENYSLQDIDAVAISEGPGSYTGLRIGTSVGKGICYAIDKPLIAINSLTALANRYVNTEQNMICALFDAMRMEVYASVYDHQLNVLFPTAAVVIDESSFSSFLSQKVVFIGPGAAKCKEVINHPNAVFDLSVEVSAKGMISLAEKKFSAAQFVDVAYFEPFYLKDFIAGDAKKLI